MTSVDVIIIQKYVPTPPTTNPYLERIDNYELNTVLSPDNGFEEIIQPNNDNKETTLALPFLSNNPTNYKLIIYDWAMATQSDSGEVRDFIKNNVIALNDDPATAWDVFYLGKWMDTCNKYQNIPTLNTIFNVVNGTNPIGFHCVLISAAANTILIEKLNTGNYNTINYALQDMIIDNPDLKYNASSPNFFVYDPLYNSVDESQVYNVKSNECIGRTSEISPPSDNDLTFFWILLLVIGVALIVWFVISSKNEGSEIRTNENKNKITY
jgi:hypothetical protein